MPKISVIIPVYNVEKYLPACLQSVIQQSLQDIEIICVNDGSTDNSLHILHQYARKESRLIIISQPNTGAGAARNRGLAAARGDYIFFVDSDDKISKDTLKLLYEKSLQTKADISICQYCLFQEEKIQWNNPTGLTVSLLPEKDIFSSYDVAHDILQLTRPNIFIKLYKRSLITDNRIYFQEIPTCNDVFFNAITLFCARRITCIPKPLVFYRERRKGSISSDRHLHTQFILTACQAIKQWILEHSNYQTFLPSLYNFAVECFSWEIQQVSQLETQLHHFQNFQLFLPTPYLHDFLRHARIKRVFVLIMRNGRKKILFNPRMIAKCSLHWLKNLFYSKGE